MRILVLFCLFFVSQIVLADYRVDLPNMTLVYNLPKKAEIMTQAQRKKFFDLTVKHCHDRIRKHARKHSLDMRLTTLAAQKPYALFFHMCMTRNSWVYKDELDPK